MKRILTLILVSLSFMACAQIQNAPPTGSKTYGPTPYISPDGLIWFGTNPLKYRSVYPKTKVDSLLALLPVFDASLYYTKTQSDARYPLLTGSYANPPWITSLTYSKITDIPQVSSVNVVSFGAIPDGITDSYTFIQNAVNSPYNTIIIGIDTNDSFVISKPLLIPSNKTIVLNAKLKIKNASIRPLAADFNSGQTTVQVINAATYFNIGDQVCISDDNQPLQAGAPIPQTRRIGRATRIIDISGNTITVESGFNSAITMAANAKIGHVTSAFLTEGATNVTIIGSGSIDMNKANQYDVEPVTMMASIEDVRYGVGLSINQSSYVNLSIAKIENPILHGISIYQSQYADIRDMNLSNYHDKGILLFEAVNFTIDNVNLKNSSYEDGITIYQNSRRGSISNVRIDDNPRAGINTNAIGVSDINIYNGLFKNNGRAVNLNTVRKVSVSKIRVLGGGVNPSLDIQDSKFIDADIEVDSAITQDVAVLVSGATTDSKFNVRAYNGNLSSGLGKGIRLQAVSANFPDRIIISNGFFSNNKLAVDIASASVSNVTISDNIFSGNVSNLTNVAASNIRINNNIGLSNQESIVKTFNGVTNIEYLKFGTVAVPASGNFVVKLTVTSYSASNTYTGTVVKTYNIVTSGSALTSTTSEVNSVIGTLPGILNIGTPFLDGSGILNIPFMGNSASSRQLMVTAEISGFYSIAYNMLPLSWGTTGTGIFPGGTTSSYQTAINLTTTGTTGAATLVGSTLNIPQYSAGSSGTVTSVTSANSNISVANTTTTPVLTFNASGFVNTTGNQTAILGDKSWDGAQTINNTLSFNQSGHTGYILNSIMKLTRSNGTYFQGSGQGLSLLTNPTGGLALINADNLTTQRQFQFPDAAGVVMVLDTISSPPATSSSTGKPGTVIISGLFRYECIATDTWVRSAVSTF